MKPTLLLAAALLAGALPAAAQETRPLDLRVPPERVQPPTDEQVRHQARRRWNAAHPPAPDAQPQRAELARPAVQRESGGASGRGSRGR